MEDWTKYFNSLEWDRFEKVDQSQNWFKVFRIMPNTYAIWEPWHREMVISYLIVGTNHTLLFDTGLGIGDISKLVVEMGHKSVIRLKRVNIVFGRTLGELLLEPPGELVGKLRESGVV